MMNNSNIFDLAIINSKAPFSSNFGKDSLDIALIFASYEQKISLFFQGDGVYQLTNGQNGALISTKDYLKTFSAFNFYDIEHIYVCESSLQERALSANFHIDDVEVLSSSSFVEKLAEHKHILRY